MAGRRILIAVALALTLGLGLGVAAVTLAAGDAWASAQAAKPSAAAGSSGQPAPAEEEALDSPRASMRAFLELCERSRYEEASRYLDLPHGAEKRGGELARKLHTVLGERLWVDVEQLSPSSQGKKDDRLPAGTEELGKVDDNRGRSIPIRLVRHEARSTDDEPRWVFAQSTVQSVDALYAALKGRWVRDHLPLPLLSSGPGALYYWQWVALPVLAAAALALGRILTTLSGFVGRRVLARREWGTRLLERLARPATLAWALVLFWIALPYVGLTLRAEDLLERVLRALGYLTFFWALLRAVDIAGDEITDSEWAKPHPNIRAITGVGVRLGRMVVAVFAFMVALSELGYPVTTVVAGLGIGGVALALAAQKTVENLFGSISILVDQPFRVGDTVKVDGIEGSVETIGLRSTRIRTVERTLVIIPNGKLADMRIESLGPRDRIRFATKLALSRSTSAGQIESIVTLLGARLGAHAAVLESDVSVRLAAIGESSFDVDVAAPVETTDATEFARIREELLLICVRVVKEKGGALALPTRRVVDHDLGLPEAPAEPPA